MHGIAIYDKAQPTLEENRCENNNEVGIRYSDSAGGVARQNLCSGNRWGIYIEKTAIPELLENDCHDNREGNIVHP